MLFLYLPSGMTLQAGKHKNNVRYFYHTLSYRFTRDCEHLNISWITVVIPTLTFLDSSDNFEILTFVSLWRKEVLCELED